MYEDEFDLNENEHVGRTHFYTVCHGFTRRLILTQQQIRQLRSGLLRKVVRKFYTINKIFIVLPKNIWPVIMLWKKANKLYLK